MGQPQASNGRLIDDVGGDRLTAVLARLPDDLDPLAREIDDFCPDIVNQGFGSLNDAVRIAADGGRPLGTDLAEMTEGVEVEDPDVRITILKWSLGTTRSVALWWD